MKNLGVRLCKVTIEVTEEEKNLLDLIAKKDTRNGRANVVSWILSKVLVLVKRFGYGFYQDNFGSGNRVVEYRASEAEIRRKFEPAPEPEPERPAMIEQRVSVDPQQFWAVN